VRLAAPAAPAPLSRRPPVTLVAVIVVLEAGCATSPLGRRQLRLMSGNHVAQMGASAFQDIKQETPQSTDTSQQRYVRCVAAAITGQVTDPEAPRQWEVVVFKDDSANAFALPGARSASTRGS